MANPDIAAYSPDAPRQGTGGKMTTKYRSILSLELRGVNKTQIANMLGMTVGRISTITHLPEYIAERDKTLSGYDQDFLNLKGKAIEVLSDGLDPGGNMSDRLRAADMWFKAQGYGNGHYAAKTINNDPGNITAEDIVRELLKKAARSEDTMTTITSEGFECAAE